MASGACRFTGQRPVSGDQASGGRPRLQHRAEGSGTVKADEGIREEIALAIENGIPVFVVGSVGGCSSIVASEYKANGWQGLNDAPLVMNNEFAESLDYVMLSKQLLDYLNEKQ